MSPVAVILYEDNGGPVKGFGLHALVVACVADELGVEVFALAGKLDGRPMNGAANIVRSCKRDIHRLGPQGQTVFALIDDDRIRDHVKGVDARTAEDVVVRAIKSQSDAPAQLEVFLLKKNTETVIEAAKECDRSLPDDAVAQALAKNLAQRDRLLNNVAYSGVRAVRDCIRGKIPALHRLVTALSAVVAASPT
ncbi:MAG: hypothetical protein ABJE95_18795 [Byssovorax sp.]